MITQNPVKALVLFVAFYSCYTQSVHAGVIVVFDLSTPNQMTVTGTNATSINTSDVAGNDGTGVYFEDFLASSGEIGITTSSYSGRTDGSDGHFTYFTMQAEDGPNLYRNGTTDPGLSLWAMANGLNNNGEASSPIFNPGVQAFKGSTTFTGLTPDTYIALSAAPDGGDIYAFADRVGNIGNATRIGTYSVVKTSATVPEPSTAIAMGLLGIVGFAGNRRRRRQESVA